MERNLQMLKIIMEHRRNEILLAEMSKDWEKKTSLEAELQDLKVREARLACALWVQPEDLPSSMQLLESDRPQQLQLELESTLQKLGLVPPRALTGLDAQQLVAPTLEQAKARANAQQEPVQALQPPSAAAWATAASTSPNSQAAERPGLAQPSAMAVASPTATPVLDAAQSQQHTLPLSGLRLPLRSSVQGDSDSPLKGPSPGPVQKGPRPHTPRRTPVTQKGSAAETAGKRFIEVGREEIEQSDGAGSSGKASGKGMAPGKGKGGKKGPPMPGGVSLLGPVGSEADGKGKGKKGPALPAGKGGRIRKVTPLGRRFHWKELPAEKLKGTVFDDINSSNSLEVQFEGLKSYFADDDELGRAPGAAPSKDCNQLGVV